MNEDEIFKKIKKEIGSFEKFEGNIKKHTKKEHFPLIYQCLYEHLRYPLSTEEFKRLLLKDHYLEIINDVYRTRVSNKSLRIISKRLEKAIDFNEYKVALDKFSRNSKFDDKKLDKNAYSLGTKVLHTFNPEENPILDKVVRDSLKLGNKIDLELCINFKDAMNTFAEEHKDFFTSNRLKNVHGVFEEYDLNPGFPKMKLLDMAIYKRNKMFRRA
jgi:hypothetical protein